MGTNENIYCLDVNGNTLYIGGHFNTINSQTRNNIAAFDVTTGMLTAWDPNASNSVYTFGFNSSMVYAGGQFLTIGGQTRNYIAALDPTSGNATSWNPLLNDIVEALGVDNHIVYAGGNFKIVNGAARNHLAAIDDNIVVPVTMKDFTASISNGQLFVSWTTNTENNNSYFDIEISADGKNFKKAGTVLSKAPAGYSSSPLKYTCSMPLNKILLLGLGGMFTLLLLPMFKNKSRKYIVGATVIFSGLFIFNSGCKKMDLSADDTGKKLFVRIVQVDKDGIRSASKVVMINYK